MGPPKQHLMLLKSCRISAAGLVLSTSLSPQKSSSLTDVGMWPTISFSSSKGEHNQKLLQLADQDLKK